MLAIQASTTRPDKTLAFYRVFEDRIVGPFSASIEGCTLLGAVDIVSRNSRSKIIVDENRFHFASSVPIGVFETIEAVLG